MVDKPWEEGAIKVIRKAQVPVVFMQNKSFILLSKLAAPLRTAKFFRGFQKNIV
jgi:hypothetical protein